MQIYNRNVYYLSNDLRYFGSLFLLFATFLKQRRNSKKMRLRLLLTLIVKNNPRSLFILITQPFRTIRSNLNNMYLGFTSTLHNRSVTVDGKLPNRSYKIGVSLAFPVLLVISPVKTLNDVHTGLVTSIKRPFIGSSQL
jgi:O-antigen/teichoic acid export membrane protein